MTNSADISSGTFSRRKLLGGLGAATLGLAAGGFTASPVGAVPKGVSVRSTPKFYPKDSWAPEVDLSGKVVVITGASRGIGLATGVLLQNAGATVIGTSRTPGAYPGHPFPLLQLELANQGSIGGFTAAVAARPEVTGNGGIDILINNAGQFTFGGPIPVNPALYFAGIEQSMAVLYGGHIAVASSLLPLVAARAVTGYARMVFTTSIAAYAVGGSEPGTAFYHAYLSSKRALLAYANSLRGIVDAAGLGITISTVNPLAVDTDLAIGTRPIFLQPVNGSGNAIGDPIFQQFLDEVRSGLAAGLPASFAGEAFYQNLTALAPEPNIAVGSHQEPYATMGQTQFADQVGTAEMQESAFPWAAGRGRSR